MSEIKLVKRIKYAGDVHAAMMELGWDAETAAAFLDSIPDADAKEVFEQMGLVKEAFEMAKADLVPVVQGVWENANSRPKTYIRKCSVCGKEAYFCGRGCSYKFCPNCGAKMDKEG